MTQPQTPVPVVVEASAHNILLDDEGLARLGSLIGALTQGHSSIALASSNIALLQHHAQALTQALRAQTQTQLTVQAFSDLTTLLEQFNALVARLPVRDARKPPKSTAPTHIWLMQSAERYRLETLQTLQRMINDFPAVKLQLAFIHYGDVGQSPLAQWPNLWCWPIVGIDVQQAQRLRQRATELALSDACNTWLSRCGPPPTALDSEPQRSSNQARSRKLWLGLGMTALGAVAIGIGIWQNTPRSSTPSTSAAVVTAAEVASAESPTPIAPDEKTKLGVPQAQAKEQTMAPATHTNTHTDRTSQGAAVGVQATATVVNTASSALPMTETSPTQVPPKVVMAPKVAQRLAVAVLAKPAAPEAKPAAPEAKVAPRPQATPPGAAPAPAKPSGVKLRTLNDHTANATSSQIKEVSTQLQELSNFDTPADLDASARADNLLPLVASTPSSPAPSSQAWIQALPDHRWLIEHTRQNTREAAALWAGSHPGLEHARLVVLPARDDQPRYALITGPFVDQAAARRYAGQIQNAIAPVFMLGADLKRQAATAP